MKVIRPTRSVYNSVAHELLDGVADIEWTDLRNALNVARTAVDACDMYWLFYGWPEHGEPVEWMM